MAENKLLSSVNLVRHLLGALYKRQNKSLRREAEKDKQEGREEERERERERGGGSSSSWKVSTSLTSLKPISRKLPPAAEISMPLSLSPLSLSFSSLKAIVILLLLSLWMEGNLTLIYGTMRECFRLLRRKSGQTHNLGEKSSENL